MSLLMPAGTVMLDLWDLSKNLWGILEECEVDVRFPEQRTSSYHVMVSSQGA